MFDEEMSMNASKVFCTVDPHLKDFVGHYYEYDKSLMEPAIKRGYKYLVLGNKNATPEIRKTLPFEGAFSRDIWFSIRPLLIIPKISTLVCNFIFYLELRRALNTERVGEHWTVFCHMVSHNQILAWAFWFRRFPAEDAPHLNLLFRFDAGWLDGQITALAFKIMECCNACDRVHILSDSERLAKDHARFTKMPITCVPIPHTAIINDHSDHSEPVAGDNTLCFISLGDAREEKGFLEILKTIKLLDDRGELKTTKFILQANHAAHNILSAIRELDIREKKHVNFIFNELSTAEYYRLLHTADCVLLPYWQSVYSGRTSGVFTEALAVGKPVIVTADTWLSDQLRLHGSGLICRDRDPADLAAAISLFHEQHKDYMKKAQEKKESWVQLHNPDALFRRLVVE